MYLAGFGAAGTSLVQGLVRLSYPRFARAEAATEWNGELVRLISSTLVIRDCATALRVVAGEGRLTGILFFRVPKEEEGTLRRHLAAFTRLNMLAEDCADLPIDREAHDRLAEAFPRYRYHVTTPSYSVGETWLACDFRMAPGLTDLLAAARALGHAVAFQINLHPIRILADWVRIARKNWVRLRDQAGVPGALVDMQGKLVDRMLDATAVAEEYLGADSSEGAAWLHPALRKRFEGTYRALGFESPEFRLAEETHDNDLADATHRVLSSSLAPDEICGAAITDAERVQLLAWAPPDYLARQLALPGGERQPTTIAGGLGIDSGLPLPHEGEADYVFVSYKREDMSQIAPILKRVVDWGYRIWYDKAIPGGAEWDAMIESRIEQCRLVLLFVSRAAVESRYVRREVKFADAVSKPVLGVRLDNGELGHGMKMLLSQYQVLDARAPDLSSELRRALSYTAASPVLAIPDAAR